MEEITWDKFNQKLDNIQFEEFDLIIAIARGGIIPASFIQQKLDIPMKIININFRDDNHNPKYENPKLLEENGFKIKKKNILLVDDVSRTGKTIQKAKEYLKDNNIKTCIINGQGDYNLFNSKTCLKMPWRK